MESKSTNISWKIMMVPHIATGIFGLIWILLIDLTHQIPFPSTGRA